MKENIQKLLIILFTIFSFTALASTFVIYIKLSNVSDSVITTNVNQYSFLTKTESVMLNMNKSLEIYYTIQNRENLDDLYISLNRTIALFKVMEDENYSSIPHIVKPYIIEISNYIDSLLKKVDQNNISRDDSFIYINKLSYLLGEIKSYILRINNESINKLQNQVIKVNTLKKFIFYTLLITILSVLIMAYILFAQKKLLNIVKKSKQEAVKASETKSVFLANMSHEIRTPLNAIIGLLHLLNNTKLTIKQQDYSIKAISSAGSLLGIINNILDFSKIEAGHIELDNIEFNIDNIFNEIGNILYPNANEKKLELIFNYPPDLPLNYIGDPLRLSQILLNLINNAIKFTKIGEIIVSVDKNNENYDDIELKFIIKDSGIGLDEKQIKNLFIPFSQADNSIARSYGGTGLGLVISKNLINKMGGDIEVDQNYDRGATFAFTVKLIKNENLIPESTSKLIPGVKDKKILMIIKNMQSTGLIVNFLSFTFDNIELIDSESMALKIIKDNKKNNLKPYDLFIIEDQLNDFTGLELLTQINQIVANSIKTIFICNSRLDKNLNYKEFLKPIIPTKLLNAIIQELNTERKDLVINNYLDNYNEHIKRNARILLVEDNEINQQVSIELLEYIGYSVALAKDGQEAINIAIENKDNFPYDVILMDLHMPNVNGYEATKMIRSILIKYIPIIALTADAVSDVKEKVIKSGMNDYITKPINPKEMYSILQKYIDIEKNSNFSFGTTYLGNSFYKELKEIKCINIDDSLEKLLGNIPLYKKILLNFIETHSNDMNLLYDLYQNNNYEEAHRIIHSLSGICGNIGAEELLNASKNLEKILLEKNFEDYEIYYDYTCMKFEELFSELNKFK